MQSQRKINGINVSIEAEPGVEVTDAEVQAYIDRFSNKNPVKTLSGLELKIEGDNVELTYEEAPQRFERIRRITGYLVGDMDRWNDAKTAEEHDRVKHGMNDVRDTYDVALYVECSSRDKAEAVLGELKHNNRVGHIFSVCVSPEDGNKSYYAVPDRVANNIGFVVSNKDILSDAVETGVIENREDGVWAEYDGSDFENIYPAYAHLLKNKISFPLSVDADYLIARCEIGPHFSGERAYSVARDGMESYIKNKNGERIYLSEEEASHFKEKADSRNADVCSSSKNIREETLSSQNREQR